MRQAAVRGGAFTPPQPIIANSGLEILSGPGGNYYYQSPPPMVRRILRLAALEPGMWVLDPSAGLGALLDGIPSQLGTYRVAVEIMPRHAALLRAKGYQAVHETDFLKFEPQRRFDRVLMAPPFDDDGGLAHVRHAWTMLASRGRIVAVLPADGRVNVDEFGSELGAGRFFYQHNPPDMFVYRGSSTPTLTAVFERKEQLCPQ